MNKAKYATGVLAVAATMMLASSDAGAVDTKWFPALSCVKDTFFSGESMTNWNGTIVNPSSTTGLHVKCPLVRDGTQINSASIQVFDRTPGIGSGFAACQINYEFASGASVFWGSSIHDASDGPMTNVQTMTYGALTGGDYYYADCFLPRTGPLGASHLVRFSIVEP